MSSETGQDDFGEEELVDKSGERKHVEEDEGWIGDFIYLVQDVPVFVETGRRMSYCLDKSVGL